MDQISTQTQEHPTWVEIKEMMRETDKRIKELTEQFTSTTGHISEGLIAPAAVKIFQKAGFNIDRSYCNLRRKNKLNQLEMEVDQLLLDDTLVIAPERESRPHFEGSFFVCAVARSKRPYARLRLKEKSAIPRKIGRRDGES